MAEHIDPELTLKIAGDIVVAYLGTASVPANDLPDLVRRVRGALTTADLGPLPQAEPIAAIKPAPSRLGSSAIKLQDVQSSRPDRPPQKEPTPAPSRLSPAVPIAESVTRDYIISLEDGKPYRSLRRHLWARHRLTPDDYRAKWGLPDDYPMVAPGYAEERSSIAKRTGLGHAKGTAKKPVSKRTRK